MHQVRRNVMIQKTSFMMNFGRFFDHFPKYHVKILLGHFTAKVGRENIFKLTIRNDNLHQDSNNNGIRIVNFAILKNLYVKSKKFLHWNIHKDIWSPTNGKNDNQIDCILTNRIWHSSRCTIFQGSYCDTDQYLVVADVSKRLTVGKQATQKFYVERFNLRKPNEMKDRK